MKKLLLFSALFLFTQNMHAQKSPKKIALIITIDNYPPYNRITNPGGWNRTWANTDLSELYKLFYEKQKFNIVDTLTESSATRDRILKELDQLAKKSEEGSIVVFSFSGHGQQIYDIKDTARKIYKDEADGYDEALVPYDAQSTYNENRYKGENHIRDEEFGKKLDAIRVKIGPTGSLLVLVDACHSGSITKAPEDNIAFRGSTSKIEPPGYVINQSSEENSFISDKYQESATMSPMFVISGSASNQLNYPVRFNAEGILIGALTNAFIKALANFDRPVPYSIFFQSIKTTIESKRSGQNPIKEGEDSIGVLGNQVIPMSGFIAVNPVRTRTDSVLIQHGQLNDIFPGMEFFVYPLNDFTYDTSRAVTKGIITAVDPFTSAAKLKKKLNYDSSYKAVFVSKAYGDFSCAIAVKGNSKFLQRIKDSIRQYKNFLLVEAESDLVIKELTNNKTGGRTLIATRSRKEGTIYDTIWRNDFSAETELTSSVMDGLFKKIKLFARAKYLRSLETPTNDNTLRDVEVKVIPVIAADAYHNGIFWPKIIRELSLDSLIKSGSSLKMKSKQKPIGSETGYYGFEIEVINKSDLPVFLVVLEISPTDSVFIRVPHKLVAGDNSSLNELTNEFVVNKKSSLKGGHIPKILAFSKPMGQECLKIFISDTPLNLAGVTGNTKSGKSFDDFLNEAINDDAYNKKFTNLKDGSVTVNPVRPGSMKIITIPFILE